VLSPTRELAIQIANDLRVYGQFVKFRYTVIFGGVNQNPQVQSLRGGTDLIIATPGRLLDLMNQGHVDLRGIEMFVLDEADRMLDMGFIHDIRKIVAKIPQARQTMLFSATMPAEIRHLADSLLKNPANVQVAPVASTADNIDQSVYFVERSNKANLLADLYHDLPMARTIVFTRTKHGADRVVRHLHSRGINAEAIHGNKSQNARQRALHSFKVGKIPMLVATDIASRGIDVDDVTHVVNYDLTHEPETYVHRIGRTARAGASGAAVSFCDADERSNLRAIEKLIRKAIPVRTSKLSATTPAAKVAFKPSFKPAGTRPSNGHAKHVHTTPKLPYGAPGRGHKSHAQPARANTAHAPAANAQSTQPRSANPQPARSHSAHPNSAHPHPARPSNHRPGKAKHPLFGRRAKSRH
jgi:ATP-dependent RNA helicase RhlE